MKQYVKPRVRIVDLEAEGVIALSDESIDVYLDDPAEDQQLSNKKSIWKTEEWLE